MLSPTLAAPIRFLAIAWRDRVALARAMVKAFAVGRITQMSYATNGLTGCDARAIGISAP
jgi:hypothetical protein